VAPLQTPDVRDVRRHLIQGDAAGLQPPGETRGVRGLAEGQPWSAGRDRGRAWHAGTAHEHVLGEDGECELGAGSGSRARSSVPRTSVTDTGVQQQRAEIAERDVGGDRVGHHLKS
jgi:hypothetical protein